MIGCIIAIIVAFISGYIFGYMYKDEKVIIYDIEELKELYNELRKIKMPKADKKRIMNKLEEMLKC